MPCCAIISCRLRSQVTNFSKDGVSFYKFPKEPDVKERWIDATGRQDWFPTKTSTICSKHFREDDFMIKMSGNRYLKPDAIPSEQIVYCGSLPNVNLYRAQLVTGSNNVNETEKVKHECSGDTDIIGKRIKLQLQETSSPSTSGLENNDGTHSTDTDIDEATIGVKEQTDLVSFPSPDITTPRKLQAVLSTKEYIINQQRKQIKRVQAQNRRLKKKIIKLEDALNEMKQKFAMRSEEVYIRVVRQ